MKSSVLEHLKNTDFTKKIKQLLHEFKILIVSLLCVVRILTNSI